MYRKKDSKALRREPNFTRSECELLVHLVRKHCKIIENKRTDAVTCKLKDATWIILTQEFNNSTFGEVPRDARGLRLKYENLKKNLKRKFINFRRLENTSGEGADVEMSLTPIEEHIMEMCGPMITDAANKYLSDEEDRKDDENDQEDTDTSFVNTDIECPPVQKKEENDTPPFMPQLVYSETNNDSLAQKKTRLLNLEIKRVRERIKQDKKQHELQCELLNIEIELKRNQLEQQRALKRNGQMKLSDIYMQNN